MSSLLSHSQASSTVQVWVARLDQCEDPDLMARYQQLLSPSEHARMQRLVFEQDRCRHVLTRALVRTVLADQVGLDPRALSFEFGPQGKPALCGSSAASGGPLEFNVSHTSALVMLAVGQGRALGIDVEHCAREAPMEVLPQVFAEAETRASAQLDRPRARSEHFWSIWTLKESLIKACGQGLSMPLRDFSFDLAAPGGLTLRCEQAASVDPHRWWLGQWCPAPDHLASLCVARQGEGSDWAPQITVREVVPLRREQEVALHLLRASSG